MKKRFLVLYLVISVVFAGFVNAVEFSIVAVGDIMLGRYIGKDLARKGYCHPYEKLKVVISSADIAFANLECPISQRGEPAEKKYCFCASTKVIEGLSYAGFNVLSLANNHTMDYGKIALLDTIRLLRENGILAVGAGENLKHARQPAVFDLEKIKVAFLAYNCGYPLTFNATKEQPGTCPCKIELIKEDIQKAKKEYNLVIVSFHWGEEYIEEPSDGQIQLAHQTIDAGADIIVGHHPHVLQGIEFYKERPIIYSLGNFVFDQAFGDTRKGIVVKFFFDDKKLCKVVCIPIIRTYDKYYPKVARGKEKEEIKSWLLDISRPINSKQSVLDRLYFE